MALGYVSLIPLAAAAVPDQVKIFPSAIAPPHSYIDASEFESPSALARYLKLLDSDDARFNEYFWWRDFYERTFKHRQGRMLD